MSGLQTWHTFDVHDGGVGQPYDLAIKTQDWTIRFNMRDRGKGQLHDLGSEYRVGEMFQERPGLLSA